MQLIQSLSSALALHGAALHDGSALLDGSVAHLLLSAAPDANALWAKELFKKPMWVDAMFWTRTILCLLTALLLIYEVRARRMGADVSGRSKRTIALVLTVVAFGVYFDFGNPNVRFREYYHRHELYHYYLGSKYSQELGYKRLYDCTMVAEIENGRRAQIAKREFRDLRDDLIKQAKDTYVLTEPERCTKHFSDKRWEAFKKDVDWFYNSSRGSYWERMQQDHGYNPPPVWTMTGKALASLHPADGEFFKALASIDITLQAGMILLLYWGFGFRVGAVAAVFWGCNAAANFYWTGGAFLRQDWLFLLVASLALARKRYFALSGAALMWSGLLRAFPLALFGGWAAMVVIHVIERARGRAAAKGDNPNSLLSYLHPDHRRLIAGAAVTLAVLVPASMFATGGDQPLKPYKEFFAHIQTHNNTPLTNHMGLPTIISHNWDGRMRFTRNDNLDDAFQEWKDGRNRRKEKLAVVQYGVFALVWLWIAWAVHKSRRLWIAPALSLPLVMCLWDLTCYYYSMYIAAAVLALPRRSIGVALLATGAASVILLGRSIGYAGTNISGFHFVDDNFAVQSYLFAVFSLLMLWAYSRPFSLAAVSAWWNRWRDHAKPDESSKKNDSPESKPQDAPA